MKAFVETQERLKGGETRVAVKCDELLSRDVDGINLVYHGGLLREFSLSYS